MKTVFIIFVCWVAAIHGEDVPSENRFPPYIKPCKRNAEVVKCVLENIERCRPHLAKGIPRLLIPALEPLSLQELDIIGNNLRINLKNVTVHNLPSVKIEDVNVSLDDFQMTLKLTAPYVYNEFDYSAEGRILSLVFSGSGHGYTNATNMRMEVDARAEPVTKNGKVYLKLDYVNVKYKAKTTKFYVSNFFNDQKELNEETNKLINENIEEFEDEITPDISKSIASILETVARNLLEKFSYDELFPIE